MDKNMIEGYCHTINVEGAHEQLHTLQKHLNMFWKIKSIQAYPTLSTRLTAFHVSHRSSTSFPLFF